MKQKQPSKQSGFTLIEVMVVIVILGVLAALIVPNVMGRGEKAKVDTTVITLKGVAGALDQYKLDNQKYPSMQDGGLDALVNQPASAKNWLPGGYVKGGYPKDSWDNDIQYVIPIFIISLNGNGRWAESVYPDLVSFHKKTEH